MRFANVLMAFGVAASLIGTAAPASAQSIDSAYSKIDWEGGCSVQETAPEGEGSWVLLACSGYAGYPVIVSEDDARMSLDYGEGDEVGTWETFTGFNRVGDTVEWRLQGGRPFATIHRWFVDDGAGKERQVLVVSTVAEPGGAASCMVGFVDANANPNANVIARGVADAEARGFRCGVDRPAFAGVTNAKTPQPTAGQY